MLITHDANILHLINLLSNLPTDILRLIYLSLIILYQMKRWKYFPFPRLYHAFEMYIRKISKKIQMKKESVSFSRFAYLQWEKNGKIYCKTLIKWKALRERNNIQPGGFRSPHIYGWKGEIFCTMQSELSRLNHQFETEK